MTKLPSPLPLESGLKRLVEQLVNRPAVVMLFGPPGAGKSTFAELLAARVTGHRHPCSCLSADPGSPVFGVPAAINLGRWSGSGWKLERFEALCSLNAARFRLPLVAAVRRLLSSAPPGALILDAPGVVRGVAGAELLLGLTETTRPSALVLLSADKQHPVLPQECASLAMPIIPIASAEAAKRPTHQELANQRTQLWEQYLRSAQEYSLKLSTLAVLGTPPPQERPDLWRGRLVGLGNATHTLAMGEVLALQADTLTVRAPACASVPTQVLIRDAVRLDDQPLATQEPVRPPAEAFPTLVYPPPQQQATYGPQVRTAEAVLELVNGLYDDPLLLLCLRQSRRCLLFDLGDTARLPLRILHRVSDVFITHAHIDHIGGFIGLLRARLGAPALCRIFGPPGLSRHIAGTLSGVLWDRIGDAGPAFEVAELTGKRLVRSLHQAGLSKPRPLEERAISDGILLQDKGFRIRATLLDHRTPVLAYAFEPMARLKVCDDSLARSGLPPGDWIAALKNAEKRGLPEMQIELPDGRCRSAGELSAELLRATPGDKVVYATDLADSEENRQRLTTLAKGAHTLFCEACFSSDDRERAERHGHLTARACGEIAAAAQVTNLVPFHFSRRYQGQVERLYREISEAFPAFSSPIPAQAASEDE